MAGSKKFSEEIENPYTGERKEITASSEDILFKKIDEQLEKWEDGEYVKRRTEEATAATYQLQDTFDNLDSLCYINLHPINPNIYIRRNMSHIFQPTRYEPTLKDAEKTVGITRRIKLASYIFKNSKEKYDRLHTEAKKLYKNELAEYDQQIKEDKKEYLKRRNEEEKKLNRLINHVSRGNPGAVRQYLTYAFDRDKYCIELNKRYKPEYRVNSYCRKDKEYHLSYRIPNSEEIPIIEKYDYDKKNDEIVPRYFDSKTASKRRLKTAESILLRTAALIFFSDTFDNISKVSITGYLKYFDSAYGNYQTKNVIHFTMTKDTFNKINLELVNPLDLFSRVLKANISSGLYSKEPYTLSSIE